MFLYLFWHGKIWSSLCGKLSAEATIVSHRQLGQDRGEALLWRMDVPRLVWAVSLGKQPENLCIARACAVSLLTNKDFYPLSLQFFPWHSISKWDFKSTGNCFTLLPLKSLSVSPLGSVGGELSPYWALLKIFWQSHFLMKRCWWLCSKTSSWRQNFKSMDGCCSCLCDLLFHPQMIVFPLWMILLIACEILCLI